MAIITEDKQKQIVLKNCIRIDGKPIKYIDIVITGKNPEDISFSEYFANDEAKVIYKSNRVEVRKLQAVFEDEAYKEQERLDK